MSEKGNIRRLAGVVPGQATSDGAGVSLTRYIGSHFLSELDPFLLLDFFESDDPDDYIAGFPSHPHRGFETVTYLLAGKMRHGDNAGHSGVIETGGIQWMTAGRGIVHSEMPEQEDGRLAGFQLWVNLPASDKLCEPAYHEYPAAQIPSERHSSGGTVRVITGTTSAGTTGPVSGVVTRPLYLDVELPSGAIFEETIPAEHSAFVFAIEGDVQFGEPDGEGVLRSRELGILGEGDRVMIHAGSTGARFLLVAARALHEPVARYGPFVMNTRSEIEQAIRDFNSGRF
ncbi:MAG: pirin family protein [Arenicellales bacterium]